MRHLTAKLIVWSIAISRCPDSDRLTLYRRISSPVLAAPRTGGAILVVLKQQHARNEAQLQKSRGRRGRAIDQGPPRGLASSKASGCRSKRSCIGSRVLDPFPAAYSACLKACHIPRCVGCAPIPLNDDAAEEHATADKPSRRLIRLPLARWDDLAGRRARFLPGGV